MLSKNAELLLKIIAVFDLDLSDLGHIVNILDTLFWEKANNAAEGDLN